MLYRLSLLCAGIDLGQAHADEGPSRFVQLLNGEAVKDAVSGLVSGRGNRITFSMLGSFDQSVRQKTVGGRRRLSPTPSLTKSNELDLDQQDPSLPLGHPFRNIKSGIYWTSTAHPTDDIVAWQMSFFSGQADRHRSEIRHAPYVVRARRSE